MNENSVDEFRRIRISQQIYSSIEKHLKNYFKRKSIKFESLTNSLIRSNNREILLLLLFVQAKSLKTIRIS